LTDNLSREQRTIAMRRVKAQDTSPEILVRQLLRAVGAIGYRLHRKDLPGKPDIAFIGRKLAIFVHGCFWHGHDCMRGRRVPKSNCEYWIAKIAKNKARDSTNQELLKKNGWNVMIVWECETKNRSAISESLQCFVANNSFQQIQKNTVTANIR
jgi:DNA mismatch endonuclease (patch repair protein)